MIEAIKSAVQAFIITLVAIVIIIGFNEAQATDGSDRYYEMMRNNQARNMQYQEQQNRRREQQQRQEMINIQRQQLQQQRQNRCGNTYVNGRAYWVCK